MTQTQAEAPQAQATQQVEAPQAKPVLDPTDASGTDGANGATDRKPRRPRTTSKAAAAQAAAKSKAAEAKQPKAESKPEATKAPKAEAPKLVPTPDDLRTALVAARGEYGRASLTAELVKIYAATEGHNVIWKAEKGGTDGTGEVVRAYLPALETLLRGIKNGDIKPERKAVAGAVGPRRASRTELEHKLNELAKVLHAEWRSIKPATVRDQLADIVGAPPAAS